MVLQVSRERSTSPVAGAAPVSIVTQLSIDRLDRLERICSVWTSRSGESSALNSKGGVVAAIFDEDRSSFRCGGTRPAALKKSSRALVSALEERVSKAGVCILKTILVSRHKGDKSELYPINELRNIALSRAVSEFVFLLDVDCIPTSDSFDAFCGSAERLAELRRLCIEEVSAIVVPCFESDEECDRLHPWADGTQPGATTRRVLASYVRSMEEGNVDINEENLVVRPFAENKFARGHRATDFLRLRESWKSRLSHNNDATMQHFYPIEYEEGFEPYVIVARQFCPLYDPLLKGYGRNKVLHLYHLNRLGFNFVTSTESCLVHLFHKSTLDHALYLEGPDDVVDDVRLNCESQLMREVKGRYAVARGLISRHCTSWIFSDLMRPQFWDAGCNLNSALSNTTRTTVFAPVGTAGAYWPAQIHVDDFFPFLQSKSEGGCVAKAGTSLGEVSGMLDKASSDFQNALSTFCSIHMCYLPPKLYTERLAKCITGSIFIVE